MVDQNSRCATHDGGGIARSTAKRRLVRAVGLGKGRDSISSPRLVHRIESIATALGPHGTFASVRGRMPPACITGDHEGFQTGNGAGDDDIVLMNLHPDTGQHRVECWVSRAKLNVEIMKTEDDEDDDPDQHLDSS